MDLNRMTQNEIIAYERHCYEQGNLQAIVELNDFRNYYNKDVTIVKGKKNIGFSGKVFWLSRQHFGTNEWLGWNTRVGIRNNNNDVVFTSTNNIKLYDGGNQE